MLLQAWEIKIIVMCTVMRTYMTQDNDFTYQVYFRNALYINSSEMQRGVKLIKELKFFVCDIKRREIV